MGVVYRARDTRDGREAAVKTVSSGRATNAAALRTEALALQQVVHPGIVPVWESGEERGRPWYSMPLLSGVPLAALLGGGARAAKTMSLSASLHTDTLGGETNGAHPDLFPTFVGLCDALGALHEANFVHRDL